MSGGQRGDIAVCAVATDKSQLYWCVCFCVFVSSHGSLGAQDKQSEVGYKVCPSRTLLSTGGDSPSPQLLSGQRGEKSTPFKQEGLELCVLRARLCGCCVWSGERGPCLSFFFKHEPTSREEEK